MCFVLNTAIQARYSDGVGDRVSAVVRVDLVQNTLSPSSQGVYMQAKNGDTTQFDYWAALRDGAFDLRSLGRRPISHGCLRSRGDTG